MPSLFIARRLSDYFDQVFADNPWAYWRMNTDQGTLTDYSGNGRDGAWMFNATNVPGPIGDGDYAVDVGINLQIGVARYFPTVAESITGTFTVEAWVRPTSKTGDIKWFGTRDPSDYSFDIGSINNGTLHVDIGDFTAWLTTAADTTYTFNDGDWYHIAFVVNAGTWTAYINGTQEGTGTYTGTAKLLDSSHVVQIGRAGNFGGSFEWDGGIDEVAIYDTALSAARIAAHYAAA